MKTAQVTEMDPIYLQLFQVQPRKGELRKLEIIKSAISCIATLGLENTTFESIGDKMGIHKAHVAYHFRDKELIIEYAIKYITTVAQHITVERVRQAETPHEQVLGIVDGAFDWAEKYPEHISVMLVFYYYCSYNAIYKKLNSEIRNAGAKRLAAILKSLPKISARRSLVQTEELARNIQALITGRLIEYFTTEQRGSLDVLRKTIRHQVDNLITGKVF